MFVLILTKALLKRLFFSICPYSYKSLSNSLFFSIVALILPRLFFSFFELKMLIFSIFALILIKAYQKVCFLYFCRNTNQSHATKVVFFSLFCRYSNQSPTTKDVLLCFCRYSNQSPTIKGVFLYFCPYSNQSPTTKEAFLYFCFGSSR